MADRQVQRLVRYGDPLLAYGGWQVYQGKELGIQFAGDTAVAGASITLRYSGLIVGGTEAGGLLGLDLSLSYAAGRSINNNVPGVSDEAQGFFQPITDWWYDTYSPLPGFGC